MIFRNKRMILLTAIAALLVLLILDIWINKEEIFEAYGEQFLNEQKTEQYNQALQSVTATSQHQLEIDRQDIKEVMLSDSRGKVSVRRTTDQAIRLQYFVTASAADTDSANRKRDAVMVEEELRNGRLTLVPKANGKSIDYSFVSVDYQLFLPEGMNLKIENQNGLVYINGIQGAVDVASYSSLVEIIDMKGKLSVNFTYGNLFISDVTGHIELENRYGHVNVDQVEGTIVLNSEKGRNFMNRIMGTVTGEAVGGSVHLREIAGPVEIKSRAADIQAEDIRGHIRLTSQSGETTLILPAAEGYTLDATVSGGRIRTQLPFPIEQQKSEDYRLKGVIGNGTWNVEIKARSGDIVFHTRKPQLDNLIKEASNEQ